MTTSNTSEKIILGIDPGTTIMGFGLIKVKGKTMEFLHQHTFIIREGPNLMIYRY